MINYLVVCLAVVLIGGLYSEADARAKAEGIVGSSHDFTDNAKSDLYAADSMQEIRVGDTGWNFLGEICRVCHVSHDHNRENFRGFDGDGLLWNRAVSSETYSMYTSETLAGTPSDQPVGKSKLCLGCHDGTVALNAYDRNVSGTRTDAGDNSLNIVSYNAGYRVGTTAGDNAGLMATHPISIQYAGNPKEGKVGGLIDSATAAFPDTGLMVAVVLENGMVQCHSCHDVHDSVGVTVVGTRLNRAGQGMSASGYPSGLCLSCHAK